jgi:phosphate transport system protein
MTRTHYLAELRGLQEETFAIGEEVASAVVASVGQLARRDSQASQALIADDRLINQRCHDLEMAVLTTIATEAPMATDVRLLATVLDTANELERVGDYAKGIANINLSWPGAAITPRVAMLLEEMATEADGMLRGALTAFLRLDTAAARAILAHDDVVDNLFNQVFELALNLHDGQSGTGNGQAEHNVQQVNFLVWVAHNLERSADRATNICQRVIFTVSGDVLDLDRV